MMPAPFTLLVIAPDATTAELERRAQPGVEALVWPRLHQLLTEWLGGEEGWTDEDIGAFRFAIADAVRARLGSSPALEDFLSPEVR